MQESLILTHFINDIYSFYDVAIINQNDFQKENNLELKDAVMKGKNKIYNKKVHQSINKNHASFIYKSASSSEFSVDSASYRKDKFKKLSFQH